QVPDAFSATGRRPSPLPAVERWKIFDNLRRSLVPPSLVLLLLLGWTVLPDSSWFWTTLAVAVPALPLLLQGLTGLFHLVRDRSWQLQWRGVRAHPQGPARRGAFAPLFLAAPGRPVMGGLLRPP